MKITEAMSDAAIAYELFERLEHKRKALGLTQEQIASNVGITRKSYGALKSGTTKLATFIAIIRQLELLEQLDTIATSSEFSPMESLRASMKPGVKWHNFKGLLNTEPQRVVVRPAKKAADKPKSKQQNISPIMARRQRLVTKE
ncbi:MAG: helix-turn-helix domain-containing protein [Gammaproteobacteria bacterium]|nr:helix-turn-helix domain-containing protein [Gammaproteobacteria bacterium]MBU1554954.1 helix-turn-helix domain-containing protein [Gammaproteobacteria bacterium]MBU2070474.1 helix-turn-helix domain-containing protein [Gammaproteobacteria bacterium]MBU2185275.1 helix-turn-helix domain-containing protein [Gammaproteobacteria bacterium]MBU2205066.1 helix-turn-helix domain-containing protein [Gammaproteobacteria bacterium]